MRTEKEMYDLILDCAKSDERIRLVTLEGSRTNPTIPDDEFKDYDISYFVTDMDSFQSDDMWLDYFGPRLMLQKPEAMTLYPPTLGNWFSYLILFEDGNKLDLTLIPIEEKDTYFTNSDGLVAILLDKDENNPEITPTDEQYWIQPPTSKTYDDCINEFWWVSTYVAKGLVRDEILFAIDHLNSIIRPALLQMMAWEIGSRQGYTFSLGKNYKFIDKHLPDEQWQQMLSTYQTRTITETWQSLFTVQELFRTYSHKVATQNNFVYPDYDEKITPYIQSLFIKSDVQ